MGGVGQLQLRDLLQETLTSFHSSALPGIDLRAYLHRIRRYCPCPHECFLALVVYTHRMRHVAEYRKKPFSVDPFSVHRLLIAGITVAVKFFSDFFYPNTRYARVGGLEPNELNSLEIKFLTLTNFDLSISIEEL
ncbi:cyclin-related 2, partial [Ramicandelaber brevisporus]